MRLCKAEKLSGTFELRRTAQATGRLARRLSPQVRVCGDQAGLRGGVCFEAEQWVMVLVEDGPCTGAEKC